MPDHNRRESVQKDTEAGKSIRKSAAVPLMIAAGAMLTGCSKQDEYSSLSNCTKDWGRAELCQGKQSGSGWVYLGPKYDSSDKRETMRSEAHAHVKAQEAAAAAPSRSTIIRSAISSSSSSADHAGSRNVSRSGFGASAHVSTSYSGTAHTSGG